MSAQPSKRSELILEHDKWVELVRLGELLLLQPDVGSQLALIFKSIEQTFGCRTSYWLADLLTKDACSGDTQIDMHQPVTLTNLMQKAINKKNIVTSSRVKSGVNKPTASAAIPLILGEDVLGVIQLDRLEQSGFSKLELDLLHGMRFQSTLALDWQRRKIDNTSQSHQVELLNDVVQLSKSISSNLDLENLINSVVSLIHQTFGYFQVYIYLAQDNKNSIFTKTGISGHGLEPSVNYYLKDEYDPVSWVAIHRLRVLIEDTHKDARFDQSLFTSDVQSELILPLISGDNLLGILDIGSNVPQGFTSEVNNALLLLGENIAGSIRNVKLYHLEKLIKQAEDKVMSAVGVVSADMPLDTVLNKVLFELESTIPYDAAAIWLMENPTAETDLQKISSTLRAAAVRFTDRQITEPGTNEQPDANELMDKLRNLEEGSTSIETKYPWINEIVNSNQPQIITAGGHIEPIGELLSFLKGYSAIGGSLIQNGQLLGVVILVAQQPDQYFEDSREVASSFFTAASQVIQNTGLYAAAHEQVWQSTALMQVAETTQSMATIDELLENVAGMLIDLVGVNGCTVYIYDQSSEGFFPQVSSGYGSEQVSRLNLLDIYSGSIPAFDQLVQTKSPVVMNPDSIPIEVLMELFPDYDLSTDLLILFPIQGQDGLLGSILADFTDTGFGKTSPQAIWDEKYLLIQGITNQASAAMVTLQTVKSREEEAYISIALLQVAQAIVSLNKLDDILASIVRITPILVGVKRCIIFLWDESKKVFQPTQYYGFLKNDMQLSHEIRVNEYPFVDLLFTSNQIAYHQLSSNSPSSWTEILSEDIHYFQERPADSKDQITHQLDDQQFRNKSRLLLGFPLAVQNEVLGVMLVEEEDPIKGLSSLHIREKRIEIIKGITQQAAIAIKNEKLQQEAVKSERMERELQLAREIQTTFLPDHLPELSGWDMDVRWLPARQVGGDFYDILYFGDNLLGFVIADVADKGMPAALFMTLIRTLIRAAAKDNPSPADVLRQVNELLIPDAKHGMFVTVFYALIHLDNGNLLYANAGHNPPIIKHQNSDELVELKRTTTALGIFENIDVEERLVNIDPGDWILLYTDGVTEAFSAGEEMFGTDRLNNILNNQSFNAAKEILDSIESSVQEFIKGVDLSDDLTLAAFHRNP